MGPQLRVVQGERRVVGGYGPRRRVVGLVVAIRVVLLNFAVVLEDVGRQLDCGDSAAVSDLLALCVANQADGEVASAPNQREPKTKMADPPPQEARVWIIVMDCDWISEEEEEGAGRARDTEEKGYQGLPQVTTGYHGFRSKFETKSFKLKVGISNSLSFM